MAMARASLRLAGLAFAGFAGLLMAPPAQAALPISCEVDRDEGVGQVRIRNVGTVTIPATSVVSWRASTGVSGTFHLVNALAPGARTFEFNGDTMFLKMGQDTCTAAVTSHPPLPIGKAQFDNGAQLQSSSDQGGAVMTPVTGDVDVYDVPDGVGTVIGMLRQGTQVPVILCRADMWCQIQQPQGAAWVWGEFLDR